MPHLLVAISSHGYGHLAQVAPVINELRSAAPVTRITLRTTLASSLLRQRIDGEFQVQAVADDFGMLQHDALAVDLEGSLRRYRLLHENWEEQVERVAAELLAAKPDLVFADVPYLTLAAASRAGIPAVAMCSLNWHAILQGYLGAGDGAGGLLRQVQQAYVSARLFLRPEPSMPMPELDNLKDIGVVACAGRNRREALSSLCDIRDDEKLVLIALGGIAHRLPIERWQRIDGVRYVVPASWQVSRADCMNIESCGIPFGDLLASSDLVITKPGYGSFTEAAVNGVPVLYVKRNDWPEEPCLVEWLEQHASCDEVSRDELEQGGFRHTMLQLLAKKRTTPVRASGVQEAAEILLELLATGK